VKSFLSSLAEVFPNAIEDDDGVVQRVAEHREQASDHSQRDLKVHELEERDRGKDVVAGRDNCG
jgi:hypothetical protein